MEIEITVENEMISAVTTGNFDLLRSRQTFLELLSAVKQHRITIEPQ